jgi:spore maturation protein A
MNKMLNVFWPFCIVISIVIAILTGKVESINNSVFESTKSAVELTLTLVGTMCLWSGIMEIAVNTSIIEKIKKFLKPIMRFLFPKIKVQDKEYQEICMNIISNLLGLGNAATPLGLKAMQSMQYKNEEKEKLSDSMAMLIVLNTASLQIIPTTVIAIRTSLGSSNPTKIIVPVWIATLTAAISAIIVTKLFIKIEKRNKNK